MIPILESLFAHCVELGASDVHLSVDEPPRFRVQGQLAPRPEFAPFDARTVDEIAMELGLYTLPLGCPDGTELVRKTLVRDGAIDGAVTAPDGQRYRFNLFRQQDRTSVALRRLDSVFRSLPELGLPPRIADFCRERDGLVIVTGPTGSGKSTTLATLIDGINATRECFIVTIEDPIEFEHASRLALVNQRQVGRDARSFNDALVEAMRQDPDVILVGEIRDVETVRTALRAAETGHLVFTTLHAGDCPGAVERAAPDGLRRRNPPPRGRRGAGQHHGRREPDRDRAHGADRLRDRDGRQRGHALARGVARRTALRGRHLRARRVPAHAQPRDPPAPPLRRRRGIAFRKEKDNR